ncbi:MAG TPA: glycoside hydrolase family 3 C-terminal domain-containing protein [Sphingomonas sp.]|nr:glycoside hydrolase family 3 C-terminal domain-containing protein [Sphingomonas sp.]
MTTSAFALALSARAATAETADTTKAEAAQIDARAAAMVDRMTLDEQISLLRAESGASLASLGIPLPASLPEEMRKPKPEGAVGTAGYVPAIPRVGLPALQESDASLGVADIGYLRPGDHATALPSTLALAATFDPALAREAGRMVGREAHAKGINVMLAGGANLIREPLGGRNFEYFSEDPLLSGVQAGAQVAGIQDEHVVSTVKHFAVNSQETGRMVYNAVIGEAALRESDLLAFEIAIERGRPGSVMCAYNKINGDYACQNKHLLDDVLKGDWRFPGWVMSDWGAVHSLKSSIDAGLDQQSPQDKDWFAGLANAVADGEIPKAKVRDMAYRIVRALYQVGTIDHPAKPGGAIDQEGDAAVAQRVAEQGMVLLKNDGILPLAADAKSIVVVGGHADKGVLEGGGSSQVMPYGGVFRDANGLTGLLTMVAPTYGLSSPVAALKSLLPNAAITYDDGDDPARAAALAKSADVVLVFAVKPEIEGVDHADLSLPGNQDTLIDAVASANPHVAVVLETGNPVTMPWLGKVGAVLEAWFPGQRGGEAIANILTGKTAPAGRLPITFPAASDQLPRPRITGFDPAKQRPLSIGVTYEPFDVDFIEGSDVGYRWFERTGATPLFPFGYGLTYTSFAYADVKGAASPLGTIRVSLRITNTGKRAGEEIAQLYVAPPGRTHRLAGWVRVTLAPGESRAVMIDADPKLLLSYDEQHGDWRRAAGDYRFYVGQAAGDPAFSGVVKLAATSQTAKRQEKAP